MKTFRINKRFFVDAKNVRDAYRIYKKEIIKDAKVKDASLSKDELTNLAKEIKSKFNIGAKVDVPYGIECSKVTRHGDLDKQITQFIKSKGYKVDFDGIDDAGEYNISK